MTAAASRLPAAIGRRLPAGPGTGTSAAVYSGAIAVAVALGFLVSRGQLLLPVALLATIAAVLATRAGDTLLAAVLAVAVLIEAPLGALRGVPGVALAEILVPGVLFVLLLRRLSSPPGAAAAWPRPDRAARAIHLAVGLFGLALALNYLRSRFLIETAVPVDRTFYRYLVVALGAYVSGCLLFGSPRLDWNRLFRFLFALSLVACLVGLAALALGLPLSLGSVRYSVSTLSSGAVRIGFLETFATVGLALALTTKIPLRGPAGLLFAAALVASGGRAALLGGAIAIAVYLTVSRRSWQVAAAATAAVLLVLLVPAIGSSPQAERLTQLNERGFDQGKRLLLYEQSVEDFSRQPLLGTGLGAEASVAAFDAEEARFYRRQLESGGHTTYASLLRSFGLAGLLPFMAALILALVRTARLAAGNPIAGFFLILLISATAVMVVSGNGSDPLFFLTLAGASSVRRPEPR